MDNSFYLKNGSVLWNGAFTPLDMAVEDGHITALSRGHHNEKGLPEVDAAGLRVLPGFLDLAHPRRRRGGRERHRRRGPAHDRPVLRLPGRHRLAVLGAHRHAGADPLVHGAGQAGHRGRPLRRGGPAGRPPGGPCLSSEYKGAMPEHLLMHTADAELFAKYQKASGGHVRYTTLAPEIPGVPG